MSVQLDWEIEDVETPLPDTPLKSEGGPGRRRRLWQIVAVATLAVVVGAAFLGFRIRQKQNEIEKELRAAIDLELTAFINGDRDLFLDRQDPEDRRWRQLQEVAFDLYHLSAPGSLWEDRRPSTQYTGTVPVVRVQQDEGWAQVEMTFGEQRWREVWFYRWSQKDGWRRVRLDPDWLGEEQALTTAHFRFTYPEREADLVSALAREMESWFDILAPRFETYPVAEPLMTVQFAHREQRSSDHLQARWQSESFVLRMPAVHQLGLATDGGATPQLRGQLAGFLADALIARSIGSYPDTSSDPIVSAVRGEVRDWAVAQLARDADDPILWEGLPTPLITALISRDGRQIIPALTRSLHSSPTLNELLGWAGLDPPEPAVRFGFLLVAVERTLAGSDMRGYRLLLDPDADRAWRDYYLTLQPIQSTNDQTDLRRPRLSALKIGSVVFNAGRAWVEAELMWDDGTAHHQVHFFRQAEDQWLLTSPDPTYFGARRTTRTDNLLFHYYEREQDWFEGGRSSELQALFSRAADDLGIATNGLVITIETALQQDVFGRTGEDPHTRLRFTSPLIRGWPGDQRDNQMTQMALELLGILFQRRMPLDFEENERSFLTHMSAFVWELERLFPEKFDFEFLIGVDPEQIPPQSLTDMWTQVDPSANQGDFAQITASYYALVAFLYETYGSQVVPALLDNVSQTDDLDAVLRLSTGHGLEEIEPLWEAWVSETYGE